MSVSIRSCSRSPWAPWSAAHAPVASAHTDRNASHGIEPLSPVNRVIGTNKVHTTREVVWNFVITPGS